MYGQKWGILCGARALKQTLREVMAPVVDALRGLLAFGADGGLTSMWLAKDQLVAFWGIRKAVGS